MKVGFDISQTAHGGGVATYTKELSKNLAEMSDLEMVYFYSSLRKPYQGDLPNVRSSFLPPTLAELFFNKFHKIPIEAFVGNIDIFHSSDWIQPPTKAKKVTTYHDAIPLKYPEWSHPKIVEVHKRRLEIVEKEIDMVIAVSQATKKDLIELSKIPEDKIVVIYEGVDEKFKPQSKEDIRIFKQKMKLPDNFILAIGGIGQRRNLKRVKEALGDLNLVVTGETIEKVSDEEMPLLYSGASALVYPSFYEGFGLPILEAMACGTPVITSNVSSMPEVGGEAAVYVDPTDTKEILEKVKMVTQDKSLKEELIKKGLIQAKKFSWEKCARETVKVYQKLYG